MSKIPELVDIGRFLASKLTCDGNNYEMVDVEFVKLDVATNPHTNLVGVRRNRQCQGLGTHLHRLIGEVTSHTHFHRPRHASLSQVALSQPAPYSILRANEKSLYMICPSESYVGSSNTLKSPICAHPHITLPAIWRLDSCSNCVPASFKP